MLHIHHWPGGDVSWYIDVDKSGSTIMTVVVSTGPLPEETYFWEAWSKPIPMKKMKVSR